MAYGNDIANAIMANDGSAYSKAASDTLASAIQGQTLAYASAVSASNSFGNLLGTQDAKGNWSGWTGIAQMMSNEEKTQNKENINQLAQNNFFTDQQNKYNEIGKALANVDKDITEKMYLENTGYTKEGVNNIINQIIDNKAQTFVKEKNESLPFTTEQIKEFITNPYSLTLRSDLTASQKEFINQIRSDKHLLEALTTEKDLRQKELDRANGIYTAEELQYKAEKLREANHSVFNDLTTEDIYKLLLADSNTKAGRKIDESPDEFAKRRLEAQQTLGKLLLGVSDKPSNSNQTPNTQTPIIQGQTNKQTKTTNTSSKLETEIKKLEKGNQNLLHLDTSKGIDPTNLFQQIDPSVKGDINPEMGINEVAANEPLGLFKNENNVGLNPLPTNGDPELTAKTHLANFNKLTPTGQEMYRNSLKARNYLNSDKVTKTLDFYSLSELNNPLFLMPLGLDNSFIKDIQNLINKTKNGSLTKQDKEDIMSLEIPKTNSNNKELSNIINSLKTIVDVENKLSYSGIANNKQISYAKSDNNKKQLKNNINRLELEISNLEQQIKNTSSSKENQGILNNLRISLEQKRTDLVNKKKSLTENSVRDAYAVVDGYSAPEKVISAPKTVEEFQKTIQAKVIGTVLNKDEYMLDNNLVNVELKTDKGISYDPSVGVLYIAVSRALQDNFERKNFLEWIMTDSKLNEAFIEYRKDLLNKVGADKKGKITANDIKEDKFFRFSLDDLNKEFGGILNKEIQKYANLKAASGKNHSVKSLMDDITREVDKLVTELVISNPDTGDDVINIIKSVN